MWSVELVLRASEMCFAPSGPMPLLVSLRVMVKSECQRLLTVGTRAIGGIPDRGEGGVRLQEVGNDLRALHLQLVAAQTANKNGIWVSAAADSRRSGNWRHTRASGAPSSS